MDLPSEPEASDQPQQASAEADRLRLTSRDRPDPDERGRVYEATRAHAEAEAADRQPAAADRSADPPGSHRSGAGFDLSPDRDAETVEAIGRVRKAEAPITADTQTAERENTCGGWLEGLEFRLKGDDRLKEKVPEQEFLGKPGVQRHKYPLGDTGRAAVRGTGPYTPESFHAKQHITHESYERIRNPMTSRALDASHDNLLRDHRRRSDHR
jgi:hypothetical protein